VKQPAVLKTAAAMCVSMSLLAFFAPPASAQTSAYQQSGALPGGGVYVMRRDALAQTAAMELWFRARASGENGAYPGISRLAITAVAASAAPHASSISELVNRDGGSLSIGVYPDIVMIGVSVPAWDAPKMLRALTAAYFTPVISSAGLRAALRDCAVAAAQTRFDSDRILQDALFAEIFASGPAHDPPTPGTAADFTKIPETALKTFAEHAFRQNNAVLSLAGAVDTQLLSNVHAGTPGPAMDSPFDSKLSAAPGSSSKTSEVAGLGFAWAGPAIADSRAATALDFIADYLFDPDHGTVARSIQDAHSDAFVNGQFITLHNPGVLLLTISGVNSPQIRSQVIDAVNAMAQPMDAKSFEAARTAFEYHLLSQTQTPTSRADNFGWYAVEGNAAYAPGAASGDYLKAVQSLDPGYIAQVVRTYLQHPAIVQLISGGEKGTST
jgi:predicted Zn-dependent peptidase